MKNLSTINKLLYLINSICLFFLITSYLSPYINPKYFWPVSFNGLIFPLLYIINILFLIYWIIGMKRQMWANMIVLIIGIQYIGLFVGTQNKKSNHSDKGIKILSYNVRLFNRYEWIPKTNIKSKIIKFLDEEDADIICIQEFYTKSEIPDLKYNYRHIGLQNKKSQWHMAIYSKYPQINKATVSINGELMNNTCIHSDIVINNDTIRVYNVHLASNSLNISDYNFMKNRKKDNILEDINGIIIKMKNSYKKRAEQAKAIKVHIENSPYSVVVCGDFNDTPVSYAYNKIRRNLKDAFEESGIGVGRTFIKIPALRIDYLLHDNNLKSFNYIQHNQKLSDHYPISCELEIINP